MEIPSDILNMVFRGEIVKEFFGNSGKVYLVKNEAASPKYIAYKRCKELSDTSIELFKEEVLKWNNINSRYIVPIYYMHIIFNEYYACMKACDGSLEDFLKKDVSEIAAFNYSLQIVKGLMDMKKSSIEHHQDFNPQNILFEDLSRKFRGFPPENIDSSHKYRMMISDFAMSNFYLKNKIEGRSGGKFPFKAPEQYKNTNIDGFAPDRFSLGVLLCLLFSGKHPCGYLASQVLKKNPKKLKTSWETWSKTGFKHIDVGNYAVKKLITSLLSLNPGERPDYEVCYEVISFQYQDKYPSEYDVSSFYIEYFDKQCSDWPREELKFRVN